jgi:hypothetical protein
MRRGPSQRQLEEDLSCVGRQLNVKKSVRAGGRRQLEEALMLCEETNDRLSASAEEIVKLRGLAQVKVRPRKQVEIWWNV